MKRLFGIVVAFVALATIYSVVVPLWEAPDERFHYDYIRYMAQERPLPPWAEPAARQEAGPESHRPPFYYVLSALAIQHLDLAEPMPLRRNPFATWKGMPGEKMIFEHTEDEAFPYQGVALAVHLVRAVSTAMGAIAVILAFYVGLAAFRGSRPQALAVASVVAFTPGFLFTSATINNDVAAAMFSSLALLTLVKITVAKGWDYRLFVICGVALGLASLSKSNTLFLLPISALALLIQLWRTRKPRSVLVSTVLIYGPWLLVGGWWHVRNGLLFSVASGSSFVSPHNLPQVWEGADELSPYRAFQRIFLSYWGLFGWESIALDSWMYVVLLLTCIVALVGLLTIGVDAYHRKRPRHAPELAAMAILGVSVLLLFYVVFLRRLSAPETLGLENGRFLRPVAPALAVLLIAGLGRLWYLLPLAIAATMPAFGLVALLFSLAPSYPPPIPVRSAVGSEMTPVLQSAPFVNGLELMGYMANKKRLHPGDALELALYWKVHREPEEDYVTFVHLLNRKWEMAGSDDRTPLEEIYPMHRWQTGDIVREERSIPILTEARPGPYDVLVGLYRYPSLQRVQTEVGGSAVLLGRIKVIQPPSTSAAPERQLHAIYEKGIELMGYDLDIQGMDDNGRVLITIYWYAKEAPEQDYTVFVHLFDANGQIVAQHDGQPDDGNFPTSLWEQGDVIRDTHTITMPSAMAEGTYSIGVGMYLAKNGSRLPLVDAGGRQSYNHALLLDAMRR